MLDTKIAPGFLIAPPALDDPNFERTLIIVGVHEDDGSMGFVITRQSDLMLHDVLKELDIDPHVTVVDRPVLLGGPVSGFTGFLLYEHARDKPLAAGIQLSETLSISPSRELLESAAAGELSGRFELVLGYAGWGPGQLDAELQRGGWLHTAFDESLVFGTHTSERWDAVYDALGVSPLNVINVPGGAQA